jgi:hypothetical protein
MSLIIPEAPKASHLPTVVQSELFDTDIEKLSAQGDECRALFQSPRPPGPCKYGCIQDAARTHLAGVVGFLQRQPDKLVAFGEG